MGRRKGGIIMPIPKPRDDEDKDEFIKRCMDDDVMVEEYPDREQRYAICHKQWEKKQQANYDKLWEDV